MSYKISAPDEYLAITGMGIPTVKITKSAWVWPLQRCTRFSVQPRDYAMDLQAMTREKLLFKLPVVFTVGPDVNQRGANTSGPRRPGHGQANPDDATAVDEYVLDREDRGDSLMKYAMLLADSGSQAKSEQNSHVESIVKGIIEGETRVLVSSMTMEEIFTEREVFKRRIFRNIQGELNQLGLKIWNANVKELRDAPNSVYFESLARKAHEGATNQARIDVAEAQLRGTVGEAKRKGEQDRELAKISAETAVQKTERDVERAQAESQLQTRQAALNRDVHLARTEADRAIEAKDEDLRKDVEKRRAAAEAERLRGQVVVKATIERESKQQAADAAAYEVEAAARADAESRQRQADGEAYATRTQADATNYAAVKDAEADAIRRVKEAEGIAALADAYGKMSHAFGGPDGLIKWLMIERGTYVELAKANASGVKGMAPKISVWNTGASGNGQGQGGSGQDSAEAMRNVYQMLPPLMTTIHDQTGISLPQWQFGTMAAGTQAMTEEGKGINGGH
jgi:flotillin